MRAKNMYLPLLFYGHNCWADCLPCHPCYLNFTEEELCDFLLQRKSCLTRHLPGHKTFLIYLHLHIFLLPHSYLLWPMRLFKQQHLLLLSHLSCDIAAATSRKNKKEGGNRIFCDDRICIRNRPNSFMSVFYDTFTNYGSPIKNQFRALDSKGSAGRYFLGWVVLAPSSHFLPITFIRLRKSSLCLTSHFYVRL